VIHQRPCRHANGARPEGPLAASGSHHAHSPLRRCPLMPMTVCETSGQSRVGTGGWPRLAKPCNCWGSQRADLCSNATAAMSTSQSPKLLRCWRSWWPRFTQAPCYTPGRIPEFRGRRSTVESASADVDGDQTVWTSRSPVGEDAFAEGLSHSNGSTRQIEIWIRHLNHEYSGKEVTVHLSDDAQITNVHFQAIATTGHSTHDAVTPDYTEQVTSYSPGESIQTLTVRMLPDQVAGITSVRPSSTATPADRSVSRSIACPA
jgi:hypothetical protein